MQVRPRSGREFAAVSYRLLGGQESIYQFFDGQVVLFSSRFAPRLTIILLVQILSKGGVEILTEKVRFRFDLLGPRPVA